MLNGDGIRVSLWVSGCNHNCNQCQNPQTWNINSGIPFDKDAEKELFEAYTQLLEEYSKLIEQNNQLKKRCNEYWEEAGLNSDYYD